MMMITRFIVVSAVVGAMARLAVGQPYDPAICQQVAGTLNIHWQEISPSTNCTGIEFTNGSLADAADGMLAMQGVSTSVGCIGTDSYSFKVSPDGLTLFGHDFTFGIDFTLTRTPNEACFVGHWVITAPDSQDWLAYISAAPFGVLNRTPAPAVGSTGLLILATLLCLGGVVVLRRSRRGSTSR